MSERTDLIATSGEIKDLAATVVQGVPVDLTEELARGHLARKSNVHKWVRLGLERDLTQVDFPLVEALLEGRIALRFSSDIRQLLLAESWRVIEVALGLTLASLLQPGWDFEHSYGGDLQMIPTRFQEIAWCPQKTFWHSTIGMSFMDAIGEVGRLKRGIGKRYGGKVQVIFPTLELAAAVSPYIPPECAGKTWVGNNLHPSVAVLALSLPIQQKPLLERKSMFHGEEDVGVLALQGPSVERQIIF